MAYFAGVLGAMIYHGVGPAFGTKRPRVFDKTGLNGKYDFTLEFACPDCVASTRAGDFEKVEPFEGPGIFQAIEKQLGLKAVRVRDAPVEVIVIDHADAVPAPN